MRPGLPRLLCLLAALAAVAAWATFRRSLIPSSTLPAAGISEADRTLDQTARAYLALEAREQSVDASTWTPELDAELYEDEVNHLWDALNATPNAWPILENLALSRLELPGFLESTPLAHGIRRFRTTLGTGRTLNSAQWREQLHQWRDAGWTVGRTHWRLNRHVPGSGSTPARSSIEVSVPLLNAGVQQRACLKAILQVEWTRLVPGLSPAFETVRIESAECLTRTGPVPFTPWLDAEISTGLREFMDPLIVADFDGDGFSEPAMVGANRIWWNRPAPDGRRGFISEPFAALPPDPIVAAVRADLDGDGIADLVIASSRGLEFISGTRSGRFTGPLQPAWTSPEPIKHPQVIAVGDVDGDGDLDVWLCQYKIPYQGGQFPTPYHDANDGFPSTLLLNDGHGHFTDATKSAGLTALRRRRTYSASFIDLNGDGRPDLVNVGDFAGIDVWMNDGHGHFTLANSALGNARLGFGMSHVIGDLNGDGRPDVLMLGMDSPVAERMDSGGWNRPGFDDISPVRAAMTFGNRLLIGNGNGLDTAPNPLARALARTGWSWGAALADFDNDRDLDLAVATGHETRASTRDYERQFWRHDLYVAGSTNDPAAELYFKTATGRRRADGASYGGWQQSSLLLNNGGTDFTDVAWLLGVAVPDDCRNLVAEDLDGDGRVDLILTTASAWPARRQRLLIFHNELVTTNHWIGFRLDGGMTSPIGARVELSDTAGRQVRWIVAGDSYRSQSAGTAHFGLGTNQPVSVTVFWPDGRRSELQSPPRDRWSEIPRPR